MAQASIKLSLLADASRMKAGLKDADQAVGKTEKSMADFGGAVKASFVGVAAFAVVKFGADAVAAFSKVEQSAGSVEAVFGDAADAITSKAEGAAEAFGLSAGQFQESAALIGSMLKNQMGLNAEEAAGRVEELTGKAADMAATFGGTTADAISAIGSLLRGERDPIERYGVSMNDAAITARALELGLAKTASQVDKTAKATATLDILNEQTADSAGQFARESDTLAGSQQILAAKVENAKAAIGEELAPAVATATGAMEALIPIVESLASAVGGAADEVQPLIEDLGLLVGAAGESSVGLEDVGAALVNTIPFFAPVQAGIANITELLGFNARASEDALRAMEDERTHGLEPNVEAEEELAGAIRDTIDVRNEANDQLRAQMDPFFALIDATNAQAEAQAELNILEANGVTGGATYEAALRKVAETSLDVNDAQLELLTSGGLTRAEFERQRVKMGLTADQAQVLIDKYGVIFTPRSVTHDVVFRESTRQTGHTYAGTAGGGSVVKGVPRMVGEFGPEVFVPDSAGRIVANGANTLPAGGGAGVVINVTVNTLDPQAAGKAVVQALQAYNRSNGGIPITTRAP